MMIKKRALMVIMTVMVLTGCGAKLRGVSSPLPEPFTQTHLQMDSQGNSHFQQLVAQQIRLGGGRLVERDAAVLRVLLTDIQQTSRQIALSGNSVAKEYERTFTTQVTVIDAKNNRPLGQRQLSTIRTVQLDERNALAADEQSAISRNAAEKSLARAVYQYLKTF